MQDHPNYKYRPRRRKHGNKRNNRSGNSANGSGVSPNSSNTSSRVTVITSGMGSPLNSSPSSLLYSKLGGAGVGGGSTLHLVPDSPSSVDYSLSGKTCRTDSPVQGYSTHVAGGASGGGGGCGGGGGGGDSNATNSPPPLTGHRSSAAFQLQAHHGHHSIHLTHPHHLHHGHHQGAPGVLTNSGLIPSIHPSNHPHQSVAVLHQGNNHLLHHSNYSNWYPSSTSEMPSSLSPYGSSGGSSVGCKDSTGSPPSSSSPSSTSVLYATLNGTSTSANHHLIPDSPGSSVDYSGKIGRTDSPPVHGGYQAIRASTGATGDEDQQQQHSPGGSTGGGSNSGGSVSGGGGNGTSASSSAAAGGGGGGGGGGSSSSASGGGGGGGGSASHQGASASPPMHTPGASSGLLHSNSGVVHLNTDHSHSNNNNSNNNNNNNTLDSHQQQQQQHPGQHHSSTGHHHNHLSSHHHTPSHPPHHLNLGSPHHNQSYWSYDLPPYASSPSLLVPCKDVVNSSSLPGDSPSNSSPGRNILSGNSGGPNDSYLSSLTPVSVTGDSINSNGNDVRMYNSGNSSNNNSSNYHHLTPGQDEEYTYICHL